MTALTWLYMIGAVVGQLALPRAYAAIPIIATACLVPLEVGVEIGPFNFYALRLVLLVALVRIGFGGKPLRFKSNGLDHVIVGWGAAALLSSLFADDVVATFVNRLGLVYTNCGIYFALRAICKTDEDVARLCRSTAMLLIPVALAMLYEKSTTINVFDYLGPTSASTQIRDEVVRARGAFAHPILAGSIGAVSLPLAVSIWSSHRLLATTATAACLAIIFASSSTGPLMSAAFAVIALCSWPLRRSMRLVRWLAVIGYVALDVVMKAPAYYILARIDLTGSSTGWHRAALIEAAINHFPEWWLAGTSYTRHWLAYGVDWSPNHADITNYYLRMGVDGGLLLLLLFIAVLAKAFALTGNNSQVAEATSSGPLLHWALGCSLFAHAVTFLSVSYFDQSVAFLCLTLAAIGSAEQRTTPSEAPASIKGFSKEEAKFA